MDTVQVLHTHAATTTHVTASEMTKPTLYVPVRIGGRVQFALVDCGAELSVMSTAFANFCSLTEPNYANVQDTAFNIVGVNGKKSATTSLTTPITFGSKPLPPRGCKVPFCVMDHPGYKLILGMDLLWKLKAKVDFAKEQLTLQDLDGNEFTLKLYPKHWVRSTTQVAEFRKWSQA